MRGQSGRIARFWRRMHPGRNPLARTVDRVEAALFMLLVAGAFLSLPFAAAFGSETYAEQTARAAQEQQTRTPATAVSLTAVPAQVYSSDGAGAPPDSSMVSATWVDARGARHTGDVLAASGSPAGTRVSVWLDERGELAPEPLSSSTTVADGIFAGVMTWFAVTGGLAAVYWLGRRVLDRMRSAAWDRAWSEARHDTRF